MSCITIVLHAYSINIHSKDDKITLGTYIYIYIYYSLLIYIYIYIYIYR